MFHIERAQWSMRQARWDQSYKNNTTTDANLFLGETKLVFRHMEMGL
jgi:hypothetical protein